VLLLIGALSSCYFFQMLLLLLILHVLSKPRNGIHRSSAERERVKKMNESTCIDKLKAAQMFAIALTCLTTMAQWWPCILVDGRGGCGTDLSR